MTHNPDTARDRATAYAWYALAIMFFVLILNFVDRQIISILAESIRKDFGLADSDLGFLYGTVFAVFYGIFGMPLGRLADRWHRGRLMALGLALWSAMTIASGFASTFAGLAAARLAVGIGEASASPAAYSMLADYFPKRLRGLVISVYSAGLYIGAGLSLVIGGTLSAAWEHAFPVHPPLGLAGWQAAFVAVGIPGVLLALLVLTLREPQREQQPGGAPPAPDAHAWRHFWTDLAAILPPFTLWSLSRHRGALGANLVILAAIALVSALLIRITGDWPQWLAYAAGVYGISSWLQNLRSTDRPAFELVFATRTMVLGFLGVGLIAFFQYSFNFWIPPYAIRVLGVTKATAGLYLGLPGALGAALGVVLGGHWSDRWKARDARGRAFVCMLSLILPCPILIAMFTAHDFRLYALLNPLAYLVGSLWVGSAVAMFQDLVLPRMRGLVGAAAVLANTFVGLALGPYVTGKIAAVTGSLATGVFSLLAAAPVGLLLLWLMCREIGEAERTRDMRAHAAAAR